MGRGPKFDRLMVMVEIASNAKVGRLSDSEFRCMVTGVWALAAKAPIRGCLLVGELEAEPEDVARQGRCNLAVAKRTMAKMRKLGMIEHDAELDCERIHDWDEINPPPKMDNTAAERQARRRARLKSERDGTVSHAPVTPLSRRDTRDGHADEVEVEREQEEETKSRGGATNENAHPPTATTAIPTGFLKRMDGGRAA
jgi:hypothetical protein